MPAKTVNFSDGQADFIDHSVKDGRYRDTSDVVSAGLRLLQQQERENELKIEALRKLAAGAFAEIDRGEFVTVDPEGIDAFLDELDPALKTGRRS